MKKNLFFVGALFVVAISFASCKKGNECVKCDGEIAYCEDEYKDAFPGLSWSTYKTSMKSAGCDVVDGE